MIPKMPPSEEFYEETWELVQEPYNRDIVEVLSGEGQLNEEEVLDRVEMSRDKFYEAARELEPAGVIDHYDQTHTRGPHSERLSLFSAFYAAEDALRYDDKAEYVEAMVEKDKELFGSMVDR